MGRNGGKPEHFGDLALMRIQKAQQERMEVGEEELMDADETRDEVEQRQLDLEALVGRLD